jgi:hypothetical protein
MHLKKQFGSFCPILDAKAPFALQLHGDTTQSPGAAQTHELWSAKYPYEDFFLSANDEGVKKNEEEKNVSGFDLLGSTERQATFLWQVSGPRFSDPSFIKQGVEEYYKFLDLRNHAPNQVIVPTIQIDLMWHTHILASLRSYNQDCHAIMKTEFNHDDALNDNKLDEYFHATKRLWKKHYGEDYFVEGGMSRGEPPTAFYSLEWGLVNPSSTIVWCWKETPQLVQGHDKSKIVGSPADCWIQYDKTIGDKLEQTFQKQGGTGTYLPLNEYRVNFSDMKQIKLTTGYERDVQRMEIHWCWQETPGSIYNQDQASIIGNPAACMVKYDRDATAKLEATFQDQGGTGTFSALPAYVVDFDTMSQTKTSTGYKRNVQRMPVAANGYGTELPEEPEIVIPPSQTPITVFVPPVPPPTTVARDLATEATATVSVPTTQPTAVSQQVKPPSSSATANANSNRIKNSMFLCLTFCFCLCILVVGVVVVGNVLASSEEDMEDNGQLTSSPGPTPLGPVPTSATNTTADFTLAPKTPTLAPNVVPPPPPISSVNGDSQERWRCGVEPDMAHIESRGLPTCLRIEPSQPLSGSVPRKPDGPLCMYGGESLTEPPMWCYIDPTASTYKSYYLWWSPCTNCGTAWRLDEDRDDDKSHFKSPAGNPGPFDYPPIGEDWLRWTGSSWSEDIDMEITPCDPEECWITSGSPLPNVQESGGFSDFQESSSEEENAVPLGLLIVVGVSVMFLAVVIYHITKKDGCQQQGSGRNASSSGVGTGGAVVGTHGGGGGGCGGGGGGCGGGGCGGC